MTYTTLNNETVITLLQDILSASGIDHTVPIISDIPEMDGLVIAFELHNIPHILLNDVSVALQTILRVTVEHSVPSSDTVLPTITLDINKSLTKTLGSLQTEARMYADRALTFGVPVRMKPMSAFHRKIVHSYLQKTPGIRTESFGEGHDRHIMISVDDGSSEKQFTN